MSMTQRSVTKSNYSPSSLLGSVQLQQQQQQQQRLTDLPLSPINLSAQTASLCNYSPFAAVLQSNRPIDYRCGVSSSFMTSLSSSANYNTGGGPLYLPSVIYSDCLYGNPQLRHSISPASVSSCSMAT